jgi:hypothetical protein
VFPDNFISCRFVTPQHEDFKFPYTDSQFYPISHEFSAEFASFNAKNRWLSHPVVNPFFVPKSSSALNKTLTCSIMGLGDHRRKKRQGQGLKPAHEQLAPLQNSRTSESSDSPSSRQADPLFFSPPGNVQDFANSNEGLAGWSETLDKTVEDIIQRKQDKKKDIFFYNPARTRPTTASERQIRWRAFPKNQETKIDMWKNADIRLNQDEYCEWEVKRRHDNELLSVTFTCETPEVRSPDEPFGKVAD